VPTTLRSSTVHGAGGPLLPVFPVRAMAKIVTVPWQKDVRHVAASDSNETWESLLSEVDQSASLDRFAVKVTGSSTSPEISEHIEKIIGHGYSIEQESGDGDGLTLVPRPSGVLYLVSELPRLDVSPVYGQSRHFRTYCVVLDMSSEGEEHLDSVAVDEIWTAEEFVGSRGFIEFVVELIASRGIDVIHVVGSKSGVDMIPTLRYSYPGLRFVVEISEKLEDSEVFVSYVCCRYGNVVDRFFAPNEEVARRLKELYVTPSKILTLVGTEARDLSSPGNVIEDVYGQLVVASLT